MNKLKSVNACLIVHLLFIMYDIWIYHPALWSLKNISYLNFFFFSIVILLFKFKVKSTPQTQIFTSILASTWFHVTGNNYSCFTCFQLLSIQCNYLFFSKKNKALFWSIRKKKHLKQMKQKYKLFIIFSSLSAPVCHKHVCWKRK